MIGRVGILAALALTLSAGKSDPLAGRVAGKPQQCIPLPRFDGPQIVDAHTILYRHTSRTIYRTGPVDGCPALRPLTTLIVEVYGGQLCRNDRFRVLEPGAAIPSATCRFDSFIPYEKPQARR